MSKFNIATEYFRACYASVEKQVAAGEAKGNLFGLMNAAAEDAIEFVRGKMRLLNPNKFSVLREGPTGGPFRRNCFERFEVAGYDMALRGPWR